LLTTFFFVKVFGGTVDVKQMVTGLDFTPAMFPMTVGGTLAPAVATIIFDWYSHRHLPCLLLMWKIPFLYFFSIDILS